MLPFLLVSSKMPVITSSAAAMSKIILFDFIFCNAIDTRAKRPRDVVRMSRAICYMSRMLLFFYGQNLFDKRNLSDPAQGLAVLKLRLKGVNINPFLYGFALLCAIPTVVDISCSKYFLSPSVKNV